MVDSSLKSWEMGAASQALLEWRWSSISSTNPDLFPFPDTLPEDYAEDVLHIAQTVVSKKAPDANTLTPDGSSGDPASLGVAVLIANWTIEDKEDRSYADAAAAQLKHILEDVPRGQNGGISHREDEVQYWADSVYMVPPFIAFYGGLQNDRTLLQESYNQIRAYREVLSDETNLWKHIMLGSWQDPTHWLTGNAWAAAGMMRVLQTINASSHAGEMQQQQLDLEGWIKDILYASREYQAPNGGLSNTIDAPPNTPQSFQDTAGTALLASVAYRLSLFKRDSDLIGFAKNARKFVRERVSTETGWLDGAVDPYKFNVPTEEGQYSPEAQAFLLVLEAARRDYTAGTKAD